MGFKLQSVMALLKEKRHGILLFYKQDFEIMSVSYPWFYESIFVWSLFSFSLSFLIFMCDYWLYQKIYVWLASLMNISVIICVHIKYCLYVVEWNFWLDLESMWEVLHCCMKNKRGVWQRFILHVFLCPPQIEERGHILFLSCLSYCHSLICLKL